MKASAQKKQLAQAIRTPLPPDEQVAHARTYSPQTSTSIGGQQYTEGGRPLEIPDPKPSIAHLGPEASEFLDATRWTERNREVVRRRAQSHGHRETLGGWEPVKGTPTQIQAKYMLAVNDILHHRQVVAYIFFDTRAGPTLRFRIPIDLTKGDPHRETFDEIPGVANRGIGVAYDRNGLLHFLNEDRPKEVRERDFAKLREKKARKEAKKEKENGVY